MIRGEAEGRSSSADLGRRFGAIVAVLIPVYGLLRVFAGLLHLFLPAALQEEVPVLLTSINEHQLLTTGLVLFSLGLGLLRRRRTAFLLAALVLASGAASGILLRHSAWLWGSQAVLLGALLPVWRGFPERRRAPFRPGQAVALGVIVLTIGYGVVGAYLLRNEFSGIHSWGDALYFTVATLTTLGFGDIVPAATSQMAKMFTVSLVAIGISTFVTAVSLVFVPLLEAQMKGVVRAMDRFRFRPLEGHVIVCYYTQVGASVVEELKAKGMHALIVEPNAAMAESLQAQKDDVLQGEPTEEAVLRKANISTARAIVSCSEEDAHNAMITLIAHEVKASGQNPNLHIVSRVEQPAGLTKLRSAGADHAVSPSALGGRMMGKLAAGAEIDELKDELQGMVF
jgi:voltage-gated potassium channel